ncbi:MAG: conjugal transfer protein TraF [Rickettsiaceae bacterium]|jgi:conjugal transfer pilus assembly protein TraF|nr:conjugal transfer protein TraF [Rickettsiaceae bacterium]
MRYKAVMVLFIFFQFIAAIANAKENFFEQRYRGWLWFDENAKEQEEFTEENQAPTIAQMEQAKKENEEFSKELDLLKHLAIRHPNNLEYIKLYKLKEKEMMDNAQVLGLNWIMANFLNPDIVDELKNPQNIYGRDIRNQQQDNDEKATLQELATKVELFVFRQDNCLHCPTLEKHLNSFTTKYGFKIEAISPDHSKSPYFKTHTSLELIKALGLEIMPTVIAVVNESRQRFELARGGVSVVDIEEKALLLAKHLGISVAMNYTVEPKKSESIATMVRQETQIKQGKGCTSCLE